MRASISKIIITAGIITALSAGGFAAPYLSQYSGSSGGYLSGYTSGSSRYLNEYSSGSYSYGSASRPSISTSSFIDRPHAAEQAAYARKQAFQKQMQAKAKQALKEPMAIYNVGPSGNYARRVGFVVAGDY